MIQRLISTLLTNTAWVIITYVAMVTLLQATLVVAGAFGLFARRRKHRTHQHRRTLGSPLVPRITVLVPAYNEEASVVESLHSLLALSYTDLEIVVINDGSSDDTMGVLEEAFGLATVHPIFRKEISTQRVRSVQRSAREPRLVVIDKENGGKADSLNAGLNLASGSLVCAVDADTLIGSDALQRLVTAFLEDERVVAAGGTVRVVNDALVEHGQVREPAVPKKLLAGVQMVEYSRAFLYGRLGWNAFGGNLIVSGAFGVFDREQVIAVGGYADDTVGEDMELVVRLRRHAYENGGPGRVVFLPDPVAWTEVPETMAPLARQRNRWFRGLLDVFARHRGMVGRPKYRSAGLVSMPTFIITEVLAPVLEFVGWFVIFGGAMTGFVEPSVAATFIAVSYGGGVMVNLFTLMLDDAAFGDHDGSSARYKLIGYAVAEQSGFRQLTVVWRVWGLALYLMGDTGWGAQTRRGFAQSEDADEPALGAAA